MTDPHPDPRDAAPRGRPTKRFPPLAWIILGLLLLIVVIAVSQCDALRRTPSGVAVPTADDVGEEVMPAAPPPAADDATLPG